MQELDTINAYWADDPELTVDALADRLHSALRPAERVLVGWGVGGAVAEALAARSALRPRRVVVLDALAPGVRDEEPTEPELLRSFAMYCGARRGRTLAVYPDAPPRRPRARARPHPRGGRRRRRPARRTRRRPRSAAATTTTRAGCAATTA